MRSKRAARAGPERIERGGVARYDRKMTGLRHIARRARAPACGALFLVCAGAGTAWAASVTNQNGEPTTLIVTEDGVKSELVVGAGATVSFCTGGCFITLPNGDRAALAGEESLELVGGSAIIGR